MSRAVTFTQAQVRRAVKAAESAGLRVCGVTIAPDGSITVNSGGNPAADARAAGTERQDGLVASWDDA